jgi:hypothetical protein
MLFNFCALTHVNRVAAMDRVLVDELLRQASLDFSFHHPPHFGLFGLLN